VHPPPAKAGLQGHASGMYPRKLAFILGSFAEGACASTALPPENSSFCRKNALSIRIFQF